MRGERRSTNELSEVERRERPEVVSRNGSWRRKTGQRLRNGRQGLVEKAEVGGAKGRSEWGVRGPAEQGGLYGWGLAWKVGVACEGGGACELCRNE